MSTSVTYFKRAAVPLVGPRQEQRARPAEPAPRAGSPRLEDQPRDRRASIWFCS